MADDRDQAAWDAFVRSNPEGLAYHLYGWKRAVQTAYGFQGFYLMAEEGERLLGVLPLIHVKPPLLSGRLVSLPYCDAGGCLAGDEASQAVLLRAAKRLAKERKAGGPELRWASPRGLKPGGREGDGRKVRMILDLPASSQALLAGLKSKLRSQVRKPERDGLSARLGGAELVDDFYAVFAENMRALGSPVHGKAWITAVAREFAEAARVGVVYTPAGEPAAGGIMLLHPRTATVPWASSLRSFNHLNPNMLLYWTFLAHAADNGFARFDFGRSTPGEGTYRFKEQWGAKPCPLYWQDLSKPDLDGFAGSPAGPGRRIAEQAWSYMPLKATTLLGPHLRRYISL